MTRHLLTALLLLATGCAHQAPRTEWPKELWPLAAAPEQHKVVFENEHVRVLRVENPPGGVAPSHVHVWPSIIIWDEPSSIRIRDADGNVLRDRPAAKPGTVVWNEPSDQPYSVENTGSELLRLYRVELKTAVAAAK